ncbi:MAG: ferredoxin family protein [Candidatus Cloacimonetes bacterium]|nr:ferredoxin family protein [Candidatus Cloacimonadota bacterium]
MKEIKNKFWREPLNQDQLKLPKGKLHIIDDRCKGCGFCVEYCPKDVLRLSEKFNIKGYHPPEAYSEEECVNCGFCEMICPEFAIWCTLRENE